MLTRHRLQKPLFGKPRIIRNGSNRTIYRVIRDSCNACINTSKYRQPFHGYYQSDFYVRARVSRYNTRISKQLPGTSWKQVVILIRI